MSNIIQLKLKDIKKKKKKKKKKNSASFLNWK